MTTHCFLCDNEDEKDYYEAHKKAPEFKHGDCSACHDSDVLLCKSEQEGEPLHYVCKECFLRGL